MGFVALYLEKNHTHANVLSRLLDFIVKLTLKLSVKNVYRIIIILFYTNQIILLDLNKVNLFRGGTEFFFLINIIKSILIQIDSIEIINIKDDQNQSNALHYQTNNVFLLNQTINLFLSLNKSNSLNSSRLDNISNSLLNISNLRQVN